jgi:transcriptional regulator with XRE-family HTH domain
MSRRQARQVEFDGAALSVARLQAGLTQEQLARSIDVTLRTIQRWQDNEAQPNGAKLLSLAAVLDIAPGVLFREIDRTAAA